ncbi:TIGR02611 family protein [Saccharopolyspora griseoalba]|uniref:TIGR02611 family protein n=1 Tax=Saccharopolyspora griseoalba TaxID=1431848 RepID=A0ABW2LRY2_9PSEU
MNDHAEPGSRHAGADPVNEQPAAETSSRRQHPERRLHSLRGRLHHHRERVRRKPAMNLTYRIVLGTVGGLVLLAGILMIPYPGPGWLVVFAGLGILATEFAWAHRVNMFAKRHYHRWTRWLGRQHVGTKLAIMTATGVIVLVTLWMLGMFSTIGGWLGLRWSWLASPLFGP